MSNWLQTYTKNCCAELAAMAKNLQQREDTLITANDNYYRAAQEALEEYKGAGTTAFVAAVNTDINRAKHKIAVLGHVCSGTKVLQAAITKQSQSYDGQLAALAQDHK